MICLFSARSDGPLKAFRRGSSGAVGGCLGTGWCRTGRTGGSQPAQAEGAPRPCRWRPRCGPPCARGAGWGLIGQGAAWSSPTYLGGRLDRWPTCDLVGGEFCLPPPARSVGRLRRDPPPLTEAATLWRCGTSSGSVEAAPSWPPAWPPSHPGPRLFQEGSCPAASRGGWKVDGKAQWVARPRRPSHRLGGPWKIMRVSHSRSRRPGLRYASMTRGPALAHCGGASLLT
eukprot:scaffold215_cov423-Prasinococcus_capsulatus_cf.AAC.12